MTKNLDLAKNLQLFKCAVEKVCRECGRDPESVKIVPASKTQDVATLNKLFALGITTVGENRVQEFLEKYPGVNAGMKWHIIGALQSNKVKYIIDKADMIESLDRMSLAEEIERQAAKIGKVMPCLVEINIARNPTHSGIAPEELLGFVQAVTAGCPHIALKGIMAVLPFAIKNPANLPGFDENPPKAPDMPICTDVALCMREVCGIEDSNAQVCTFDAVEAAALKMAELAKSIARVCPDMIECSMGMSGDFAVAIRCGATILRPGRILFGER